LHYINQLKHKQMKKENDNKQEIIATRRGGLGSSDAKLVYSAGRNGKVSDAQRTRLAVMLGLAEQKQFSTKATDYGNHIEQCIFETLKGEYPTAISNPFTKHQTFSEKYNFDIFNHIDFEVENEHHIIWFECKAVNDNLNDTLQKYSEQLNWHQLIGKEKAKNLNKDFCLYLVHYQTSDKDSDFDASKISIQLVENEYRDMFSKGFEIISKEIENFTYNPSEEISAYTLPADIQKTLEDVYLSLKEIDKLTKEVEKFKTNMLQLMETNDVKSIDNDLFKLTTVAAGESIGFDSKKFESENTELYQKYVTKRTVRKSYLKVTIK